MIQPQPFDLDPAPPSVSRARTALLKRLADVVCLPASRINAFERSMVADLLVEMLCEASADERCRMAKQLSSLSEVPSGLLRFLLRDQAMVARPLLENCAALGDLDLIDCIRKAGPEHRLIIAARRGLGEVVCEALVEMMEPQVIEIVVKNDLARLPPSAVEALVAASREHTRLINLLLRRAELRPHHAYALFWWADADARRLILQRFAVSREVLQDAAGDVFAVAAEEGWSDPLSRKALQFIERRQRNRAAIEKSPFDSLEAAVAAAATGMTRETAEEIAYLSGVKPMTAAKIFTDPGGEEIAILCKATGLPRTAVRSIWRGLKRQDVDDNGLLDPRLERVLITHDMIAVDRAQTVLRYWNWSLSSGLTPALIQAIRQGDEGAAGEYSIPERTAMLALGRDLGRRTG